MIETIEIYPEYESLKGISPFWDNEKECIPFPKNDYEQLQDLINKLNINTKVDNFCYILILIKQEKSSNIIRKELKTHSKTIENDRLQTAIFLKLLEKDKRYVINKVRFDIAKLTGYNSEKKEYEYAKEDSFYIQNPDVIAEILKIIWNKYKYISSVRDDFTDLIKKQSYVNKPTILIKNLAQNLYNYLSKNTSLGENKKYFVIGYLFQLSELETEITEKSYSDYCKNAYIKSYKSYSDFVTTNIRNKYFKGGRKTSPK